MYYKVVSQQLTSVKDSKLSIKYRIGSKTKSLYPYAPLFVFDNLESAINFNKYNTGNGRIFECEIEKSKRKWGAFLDDRLEEILAKKKQKKRCADLIDRNIWMMKDAVLADSVTLLREVDDFPEKIYYKVVTENFESAISIARLAGLDVKYFQYQWTYPRRAEAPLMVFGNLDSAKEFVKREFLPTCRICHCKIKKSNKKWGRFWIKDIKKILNNTIDIDDAWHQDLIPGTVLADAVYLMNEVVDSEN